MNNHGSDNESETLEKIEFKYTPPASPIPQVTRESTPSSDSGNPPAATSSRRSRDLIPQKTKAKRRKSKKLVGQGHHVLFRSFAPDYPELNKGFSSRIFDLSSPGESDSEDQMDGSVHVPVPGSAIGYPRDLGWHKGGLAAEVSPEAVSVIASTVGATSALVLNSSMQRYRDEGRERLPPIDTANTSYRRNPTHTFDVDRRKPSLPFPSMSGGNDSESSSRMRDAVAVDGLMKLSGESPRRRSMVQDIMNTSPILQQHIIPRSQRAMGQTLPAITDPSPSVETIATPKSDVSLPPVRSLIGEAPTSIGRPRSESYETAATDRPRATSHSSMSTLPNLSPASTIRTLPPPLSSPYHAVSMSRTSTLSSHDAGSPSWESYNDTARDQSRRPSTSWSTNPRRVAARSVDAIPPFLSRRNQTSSSSGRSGMTSSSINTSQSAASTTSTNTEPYSPSSNSTGGCTPQSSSGVQRRGSYPYSNYPTVALSGYKCRHEGCEAPPFATQYLLNSHANVHSHERPHYCPEPGCLRGKGGKGFKRKNEMIRHGLVHKSPGYVCPWCPEREHRYPRPDNLQRHVRMHHEDKDKHDPKLLEVLALRTSGGSGRRAKKRG